MGGIKDKWIGLATYCDLKHEVPKLYLKKKRGVTMTEREFQEFHAAALAKGRIPMVSGRIDSDDLEIQEASEFIGGHALLPKDYENIPRSNIAEMGKLLLDRTVTYWTKEAVMIILAHHGSDEALFALKEYNKNPDKELRFFAEMALDECLMWNE